MAIQDKNITLVGAQTAVAQIHIFPQVDGSYVLVVQGITKDGGGAVVTLAEAKLSVPSGVAALDNMATRALTELRKANGLEV